MSNNQAGAWHLRAFRNNYVAALIAGFLISASTYAQVDTNRIIPRALTNGQVFKNTGADSSLQFPQDTFFLKSTWNAIAFKDGIPYYWNNTKTWTPFASGGPGGGAVAKAWFGLTKSTDSIYGGGLVPGILHYWVPNNFDPALKSGQIRLVNIQNSDSINGYGPFTGGRFLRNEDLQQNDPTYSQSMFSATRILAEEYGDTARSQYGGIISLYQRRVFDSTGGIFGPSATKKYIANSAGGVYVTNQLFPPRDSTDIFAGADGHSSSSFESNWGFGGSWGYNVHIFSGVPGYPLNGFAHHTDLQREASHTRVRHATGNGFSGYVADWRGEQQAITPSSVEVGHYISKVADFTSMGSTDWNLSSGGATKAKILAVSSVDTVMGFHSLPKWRLTNETINGISLYAEGDSDLAHIDGKLSIGGALPTHSNGKWNDYKLTVNGDQYISGSLWYNIAGRIVGTSNTPTLLNPGTLFVITKDSSEYVYMGSLLDQGGSIKTVGNNVSDNMRGGVDVQAHWGQNVNAGFRVNFRNYDGSQENRFRLQRDKLSMELIDSVSMRAQYYLFRGNNFYIQADSGRMRIRGKNYTFDTLFKVGTASYDDGFSIVRENNSNGITTYARNFASGNFTATGGAGAGFTGGIVQFSGAPVVAYQDELKVRMSYPFVRPDPTHSRGLHLTNDTLSTGPFPWLDSTQYFPFEMGFVNHNNGGENIKFSIRGDGVVDLYNVGSAPSSSVTGGIRLFSDAGELKVRDAAGNVTVLSPHNFKRIPGGRSEEMAWSYSSERGDKWVAADMTKALRTIEKQSVEIEELKLAVAKLNGKTYAKKKPVRLVHIGKVKK
jgi:phage baseplate assembly protein gpV